MTHDKSNLMQNVHAYWQAAPCGTEAVSGNSAKLDRPWFQEIEQRRYLLEPFIHGFAQFTRHRGKRLLEIGVGAGTDHLQWARAGAICHGVDLTEAAIDTTRHCLRHEGLTSELQTVDAEHLPFESASFDVVYSWGVIHHSEHPEKIVAEIHRILKPGGAFIGMMYSRYSLVALRLWIRHALFKLQPWRSLSYVISRHMESLGTKAYTQSELRRMFSAFSYASTISILTPYDKMHLPTAIHSWIPGIFGWYLGIKAQK